MFCNWDVPNLADGALIHSPLQACATYGKLMPPSLFAICSFCTEKLPSSVKLKGQTPFCSHRRTPDFSHMHDRVEDTCHQPAVQLIIEYIPGNALCPIDWLGGSRDRLLIGIEWDCSVRQCSDFANVRAWIWQNH